MTFQEFIALQLSIDFEVPNHPYYNTFKVRAKILEKDTIIFHNYYEEIRIPCTMNEILIIKDAKIPCISPLEPYCQGGIYFTQDIQIIGKKINILQNYP